MAQPLMLPETNHQKCISVLGSHLIHLKHFHSVLTYTPKHKFHANMKLECPPLCCCWTLQRSICSHQIPAGLCLIFSWCIHYWANNLCAHEGVFARPFLAAARGHHDRFQPGQLPLHTNVTLVTQSSYPCSRNVLILAGPKVYLVIFNYLWLFACIKKLFFTAQ